MDVRLAAFGKLCAGFDTTYGTRGEAGLATDQVGAQKCGADSNNKAPCARDPSHRHGELLHPQDVRRHCEEKMHMHFPVPH